MSISTASHFTGFNSTEGTIPSPWRPVNRFAASTNDVAIARLMNIYNGIGAGADALNYLGYAHRQLEQYDLSLQFYEEALELDPDHLQAHEYLGELYIQTGHLDNAATQLETLTRLCGACEESEQLAEAISNAQAGEQHSALGTDW